MAQPLEQTPFGDPAIAALPVVHPRGPFSELGLKFKEARFMKKEERPPKVQGYGWQYGAFDTVADGLKQGWLLTPKRHSSVQSR